jgi:hypothetical protein
MALRILQRAEAGLMGRVNVTNTDGEAIGERQIRALVGNMATAIRAKDVEALMTHYAPDVLAFDLLPRCNTALLTRSEKGSRRGFPRSKVQSASRCAT